LTSKGRKINSVLGGRGGIGLAKIKGLTLKRRVMGGKPAGKLKLHFRRGSGIIVKG